MGHLKLFTKKELNSILNKRSKETKFGQSVKLLPTFTSIYESIVEMDVKYVILGITEDIGVIANNGLSGTYNSWETSINFLLNCQDNAHNHPDKVLVLGTLQFPELYKKLEKKVKSKKKQLKLARELTAEIDREVTYTIYEIVKAGKIPIVIGGGHNNSYGIIKGTALNYFKPINAVNFDAHADFRSEEGRHSGNGFSYAFGEGFLKNYFVFGLHENYNSANILKAMDKLKQVEYSTFEEMMVRDEKNWDEQIDSATNHVVNRPFGIEIDCDAIEAIPSSAMTPSGFGSIEARKFVNHFGKQKKAKYLHICEASPDKDDHQRTGKLISYLITDFIRAHES